MTPDAPIPDRAARHQPVLPAETLAGLDPQPGETFVDCTIGAGGHARVIADRLGPSGRLIGLDRDVSMLAIARPILDLPWVTLVHSNFDQLRAVLDELGVARVDGILADLGFASDQLEQPQRGLSFQVDGPLDMRLNRQCGPTARDIVAQWDEHRLAELFWKYGEERFSRRIARKIVEARRRTPIETTRQLAELVHRAVPSAAGHRSRIDPATRVFQALRIEVNDELGALERLLQQLPDCLKAGGRAAIISFHSLEDRQIKRAFRNRELWEELTRKPIVPSAAERAANPRSRSAKLRLARLRRE